MYDVIVVGGGIAGLVNSILLSRSGLKVALFEKKSYPFHRVCGEYISNEVKPFLVRNELFPEELNPTEIANFRLTSLNGKHAQLSLKMGGFGISRFSFDHYLFQQAESAGVEVYQNSVVIDVRMTDDIFYVATKSQVYETRLVIGAHGKRSILDKTRKFMQKKSPYLGVKYHIKTTFPDDEIALHNFQDGYCGISQVEGGISNLCYLSHRDNLRKHKTITEMEQAVLHQNPFLKRIWNDSEFLFDEPLVINEISFEKKELVHNHILMCGDTAGMITPLCGNGMAMAIRSANLLSELILESWKNGRFDRQKLETAYIKKWSQTFAFRLWTGRKIQKLFGSKSSSNLGVSLANVRPLGQAIVGLTHGKVF